MFYKGQAIKVTETRSAFRNRIGVVDKVKNGYLDILIDGTEHAMAFGTDEVEPYGSLQRYVDNIDEVIRKYAAEAERIYENRTAGDYTWVGVLGQFLIEATEVDD